MGGSTMDVRLLLKKCNFFFVGGMCYKKSDFRKIVRAHKQTKSQRKRCLGGRARLVLIEV